MKKLLSIIIPVYNVEDYLERCLDSIILDDCNEYEIILINDGSKDKSLDICKRYLKKSKNILLINQTNHGVSYARNQGIKKSNGEYIVFIDSDDYCKEGYIQSLLSNIRKMKNEKIDLAIYNHYAVDINGKTSEIKTNQKEFNKIALQKLVTSQKFNALWDKIFCKQIILDNGIFFEEDMKCCEDGYFFAKYIEYVKVYKTIEESYYYYIRNTTGAVSNPKITSIENYLKLYDYIVLNIAKNSELISINNNILVERLFLIISMLLKKESEKTIKKEINKFKEVLKKARKGLNIKNRLKLFLIRNEKYTIISKLIK